MKLYQGDCMEIMKLIPDKSVDMILCDLPYGTTACKWDNVIPFEPLWEQYNRIIKDNGAICLFGSEPFSSLLRTSNLKMYKYDWVWEKSKLGNFLNCKNSPMKKTENIMVFSEGSCANGSNRLMPYYPQGLKEINKQKTNGGRKLGYLSTITERPSRRNNSRYIQQFTGYPHNVLKYKNEQHTVHPTQKPVALLEYLIKTYTKESETVLDNCMGSGSVGVACKNTNRKFIGIELDKNYFEIAKKRIENNIK